ncbi:hypothetical protein OF001_U10192 [Pseudomonas sp. OF001]|nr:hypothetical protein OF001_U10192 [Pseudomonas sp. OF001]
MRGRERDSARATPDSISTAEEESREAFLFVLVGSPVTHGGGPDQRGGAASTQVALAARARLSRMTPSVCSTVPEATWKKI